MSGHRASRDAEGANEQAPNACWPVLQRERDTVSKKYDSELMATELSDDELAEVHGGWGQQPVQGFGRRGRWSRTSAVPGQKPGAVGTLAEEPAPVSNRPFDGSLPPDMELVPASAPGGYILAPKGTYTEPELEPGSVSPEALKAFHAAEAAKKDAAEANILANMAAADRTAAYHRRG